MGYLHQVESMVEEVEQDRMITRREAISEVLRQGGDVEEFLSAEGEQHLYLEADVLSFLEAN